MPAQPLPAPARAVRLAGLLYLVIIVTGLSAELALRGPLLAGGPEQIAAAVSAALPRFRMALLADVVMLGADIALALLFWRLLRGVSEGAALAAMVLRLMQATLIGAALVLLSALPFALAQGEIALAALLAELHATGYDVGLILFGANSLIMARLLGLSGGVPKVILGGIALSGLVYMTGGLARLAAPAALEMIQYAYALPMLAESALCFWLLVRGRI